MNKLKNKKIAETRQATKHRRQTMVCKTFSCKVDRSHLSRASAEFLRMCFVEAKWIVNDIISSGCVFTADYKKKKVVVLKDGKIPEERSISFLPSQIRQSLVNDLKRDIISLSKAKNNGVKVGVLRFRSQVSSLPLNQVGKTIRLVDDKHVKIQGNKGKIKIQGFHQIQKEAEIAKAFLVQNVDDYFVKLVCFVPLMVRKKTGRGVGLDLGITHSVVTSDGAKFKISVPESNRLKRLKRGQHRRQIYRSNGWNKTRKKVAHEYEKVNNKKNDLKCKLVSRLVKEYDVIVCQDESIQRWKGRFGRQVQHSCLKGIIVDLKRNSDVFVMVDKFYPSTKTCDVCGSIQGVLLSERVFRCRQCGNEKDRDIHSAINILNEGLRAMRSAGHVKMPVELSGCLIQSRSLNRQSAMLKQEAVSSKDSVAHKHMDAIGVVSFVVAENQYKK